MFEQNKSYKFCRNIQSFYLTLQKGEFSFRFSAYESRPHLLQLIVFSLARLVNVQGSWKCIQLFDHLILDKNEDTSGIMCMKYALCLPKYLCKLALNWNLIATINSQIFQYKFSSWCSHSETTYFKFLVLCEIEWITRNTFAILRTVEVVCNCQKTRHWL